MRAVPLNIEKELIDIDLEYETQVAFFEIKFKTLSTCRYLHNENLFKTQKNFINPISRQYLKIRNVGAGLSSLILSTRWYWPGRKQLRNSLYRISTNIYRWNNIKQYRVQELHFMCVYLDFHRNFILLSPPLFLLDIWHHLNVMELLLWMIPLERLPWQRHTFFDTVFNAVCRKLFVNLFYSTFLLFNFFHHKK